LKRDLFQQLPIKPAMPDRVGPQELRDLVSADLLDLEDIRRETDKKLSRAVQEAKQLGKPIHGGESTFNYIITEGVLRQLSIA